MSRLFAQEVHRLDALVAENCARVEDAVRRASAALFARDAALAEAVIAADAAIDRREAAIEEECLKLIALHQPVASDLRHLVGVVKINLHLERAGDLAANLARKARNLSRRPPVAGPAEFADMARRAADMIHDAIDVFLAGDAEAARDVMGRDLAVDRLKRVIRRACETAMAERPEEIPARVIQIAATRNLERIADMAVNIAGCLIYAVEGEWWRPPANDLDDATRLPEGNES